MIEVKEAVDAAIAFAEQLYGSRDELGLMLEEVEPSGDERYWLITLSLSQAGANPFEILAGGRAKRDYKVFKVDAGNGKVISMKIRLVALEEEIR